MRPIDDRLSPSAALVPIDESQALDPYPERWTQDQGVCPHTDGRTHPDLMVTDRPQLDGPLRLGDIPQARAAAGFGRRRMPWVSVGLYACGQLLLALAIAVGQVGPVTGIGVCLLWLICGLLLIAAQIEGDQS